MFSSFTVPLAFAASALANLYINSPVASTTFTAGQLSVVSWIDDGNAPSLAQLGNMSFGIYAGNSEQQTLLQSIATYINVSGIPSFQFVVDGTIGPDSGEYFIRATAYSYTNPSSPQYPAESFSSLFALTNMTGTFNTTVQAEINGQSTAPIGGTQPASSPVATATAAATITKGASTTGSSSPATTSSTSTTSTNAAGKPIVATGIVALAAALVGASFL